MFTNKTYEEEPGNYKVVCAVPPNGALVQLLFTNRLKPAQIEIDTYISFVFYKNLLYKIVSLKNAKI